MSEPRINLMIDGKTISAPKGTTIFNAAKENGIEIPIFCYHDRMPPFGACRMCLVEVENRPKLQTSCTLEATEGMVVKTQSAMAKEGRNDILELLLINHPLDCPVCDRGGECPLQEHVLKYGPGLSRFFEEKRRFQKALPLGPVLTLDRERCIICARCTRFGDVIAGDHALEFIDRGYKTEVGTPDGGPAKSKFIGNTIMICPVGALTSSVYRFRARPWDNYPSESTCTLCPVGCSLVFDSRDGEIMRTRAQENRHVNDIWLCDKGWFGYEFSSHPERLQTPLIRQEGRLREASWEEALTLIAEKIAAAKPQGKIAGLGGNPLSIEENYLFQKLIRTGAGVNHLDHRIGTPIFGIDQEGLAAGMEISIGECEQLNFAILCGIDLTEEFPVIWLRLRQAINRGARVLFLGHFAPEIAALLSKTVLHAPGKEVETLQEHFPEIAELAQSGQGALFLGRQYLHTPDRLEILSTALKFLESHSNISLNLLEGHANSLGARLAGMRPDVGPAGEKLNRSGFDANRVIEESALNGWDILYVAGANLKTKFPANLWAKARSQLDFLIVQDLFLTETAQEADVVLPTLSYVEKEGSFLNIEQRLQKIHPGKELPQGLYSDGEIFIKLAQKLNCDISIDARFEELLRAEKLPLVRSNGMTAPSRKTFPGSLFATFAPALFDNGVRMKHNPHVIQLAPEARLRLHPLEAKKRALPDGTLVQLSAYGNCLQAKIQWDEKVAQETIVVPLGFDQIPAYNLGTNLLNGLAVEITKI